MTAATQIRKSDLQNAVSSFVQECEKRGYVILDNCLDDVGYSSKETETSYNLRLKVQMGELDCVQWLDRLIPIMFDTMDKAYIQKIFGILISDEDEDITCSHDFASDDI